MSKSIIIRTPEDNRRVVCLASTIVWGAASGDMDGDVSPRWMAPGYNDALFADVINVPMPFGGMICDLYAHCETADPSDTIYFIPYINGVATDLSAALLGAQRDGHDTEHTAQFEAGDKLAIAAVTNNIITIDRLVVTIQLVWEKP